MSVSAVHSTGSPLPAPPSGLPTDRPPTPDEVQQNHQAFQSSLVGVYQQGVANSPTVGGNSPSGIGPPNTQVLGNNPNDAFQAGLVDSFLDASRNQGPFGGGPTPPPYGGPATQPPFGSGALSGPSSTSATIAASTSSSSGATNAPVQAPTQQVSPLASSGVGIHVSTTS